MGRAAIVAQMLSLMTLAGVVSGDMTAVEPALLAPLTQVGAVSITNQVGQASQSLQSATDQMNSKITECNNIMESYKQQCIDCVKQKCQEKANSCGKEISFSGMVINSLADFGSNVINSITNIGGNVIDTIVDTGKDIIKKIIGWGRRRRNVHAREPSCSQFEHQETAAQACLYYQSYCSRCTYDANRDCPGYTSVKAHYDSVVASTAWLNQVGDNRSYQVEAVSYDGSSYDPQSVAWRTVSVTINLFGRRHTFYSNQPLNPFDYSSAGVIIANQALAWFKTL